jgi:DHA2 family multidrug resistance protein-like MFS transporter
LLLPTLLLAMDLTVLHLAVPALTADLKPTSSQLLWITDIYGFLIAGSLITMGTLGDRIGRRKLLLIGGGAFAVASVIAAFSSSAGMLIATRALLGIAGATLMPSTMSLIRNMFLDPKQRTVAIGIWISGFSVGSAIGPLMGGVLLEHFWWGSVFLLNVPVMALLLIVGPILLPEYRDPQAGRLDLLSAAMSLVAVLAVIFGIKQVAEHGLTGLAVVSIGLGLTIGVAFIRRQQVLADPLIDLKLFANRAFSVSLATNTLTICSFFGVYLFIAQYLQLVVGLSPLEAGLWSLPGAIISVIGSNLSPVLVRWVRPAFVIAGGMALVAAGFGLLTQIGTDSLAIVVASWIVMSLGFGMTFTLTSDLMVGTAPPERAGAASAIAETGAEFGGALGIALLGSLGTAVYRSQIASAIPVDIPAELAAAAQETLGGAVAAAGQLGQSTPLAGTLLDASYAAFVSGLQLTSLIGLVVVTTLAIVGVALLRHIDTHAEHDVPLEPEFAPAPAGD